MRDVYVAGVGMTKFGRQPDRSLRDLSEDSVGTAIKDASRLLRSFIHPALPPTIALMSFVLGLNLLADSLREQSMNKPTCASHRAE